MPGCGLSHVWNSNPWLHHSSQRMVECMIWGRGQAERKGEIKVVHTFLVMLVKWFDQHSVSLTLTSRFNASNLLNRSYIAGCQELVEGFLILVRQDWSDSVAWDLFQLWRWLCHRQKGQLSQDERKWEYHLWKQRQEWVQSQIPAEWTLDTLVTYDRLEMLGWNQQRLQSLSPRCWNLESK